MANKAQVELRIQNDEPTVMVRMPKGATLGDIAKVQASLFSQPERLGEAFGRIVRNCPNCISGVRLEFGEERVNPAVRDIQEMFTHLATEMRSISTRLSSIERGAARPDAALAEGAAAVGVIEY
jgi:hypothetical protein